LSRDLAVHCLVFPEFAPNQPVDVSSLSSEDVLVKLVETGAWFSDPVDEAGLSILLDWIQATPGYLIRYGSLGDAIAFIEKLLD
jgi:hypothetical protein